jgi:radical SAM superfamily enzyme YgiQ (UPF0313 family)
MFGNIPKYVDPLFRPPAEANSLIFQVAYGCPHNTCKFCGMYKGVKYKVRDEYKVLREFEKVARRQPDTRRIFLADGDAMALPFEQLKNMLEKLNEVFPKLGRVNVYANGSSIMGKTESELRELRGLKLNTLYIGLESGDQRLLDMVDKRESVIGAVMGVERAQALGFKCSVMVLLGLGGSHFSGHHANLTAEILNQMQPRLLSALRFVEVPGLKMFDGYKTITEHGAVVELRRIIGRLKLKKTVFRANHSSNPVPLAGRFPNDKLRLLAELDQLLESGQLDTTGPGSLPFSL